MFKSKKSTDAVETPPSAKASVGSSAWRRRVGESARNKLGLSRHETDDLTGDVSVGVSSYRAAAAKLKDALAADAQKLTELEKAKIALRQARDKSAQR